MKSRYLYLLLPIFLFIVGCSKNEVRAGEKTTANIDSQNPLGQPEDYFPADIGRTWHYQVRFFDNCPLEYQAQNWPRGSGGVAYSQRGRYRAAMDKKTLGQVFDLILQVQGHAPKQGPLKYPDSVEVKLVKDSAEMFGDCNHIYFAISHQRRFEVMLVTTYPSTAMGAPSGGWGEWGTEDGYAMREFFFGEKPGIAISLADSPDSLEFVGPEGDDTLHFRRSVKSSLKDATSKEPGDGLLDRPFTEDTWFKKGVGLIRLEQTVEGKKTMSWELVQN